MPVRFVQQKEIDRQAWDKCVHHAFYSTIYALSWYLDSICDHWDGLVEDDYTSVMPLPRKKKWLANTIYIPGFAYELGIYSKSPVDSSKVSLFLKTIPKNCHSGWILLNKFNPLDIFTSRTRESFRYEYDLIKPYYRISSGFHSDMRRRLHISVSKGLSFLQGLAPNDMIRLAASTEKEFKHFSPGQTFHRLRILSTALLNHRAGEVFGIYNKNNQLAAAGLFAFAGNRITLLYIATNPPDADCFPEFYLIDRMMEKYAETNTTLVIDDASTSGWIKNLHEFNGSRVSMPVIRLNRYNPLWTAFRKAGGFSYPL